MNLSGSYTYDNMVVPTVETTPYTWDFENRLTGVTLPGTGGTVNFQYDPFGRRIYKSSPPGAFIYVYDGDNIIEELNAAGSAVAQFTQGSGIDEPLAQYQGSTTSYFQADGLGSITSLTDSSGQLAASYIYDSFGNVTASTGTVTNPFQYTGREFDSETSLYYYRGRYYDPSAGRFLSEDPIGFGGGGNFYAYVTNRPLVLTDPLGLDVSWWDRFKNWVFGPPKPKPAPQPKPENSINLCDPGQTRLFAEAGPNPYYNGGQGRDDWFKFQNAFIDKCIAAKKPGKATVTICSQGVGILGPFAYCDCCEYCEATK